MNVLPNVAALLEAATGLAFMIAPSLVGGLLLGAELNGVSVVVARVAGIALFSLGLACMPGRAASRSASAGILIYNVVVTFYLLYLGIRGQWVGVLLWPAAAAHLVLSVLLTRAWFSRRKPMAASVEARGRASA
jgi:hypothetical protein